MSADRTIIFADIANARALRDPRFASLVIRYLAQPDAPENAPEEPPLAEADSEPAHAVEAAASVDPDDDPDEDGDEDDWDDDDWDDDDDDDDVASPAPVDPASNAWTVARLRAAVAPAALGSKTPDEQKAIRREAWRALMAAPHPLPRLRLGDLLIDIYEEGTDWARTALVEIFREARLGWGIWKGLKRIYKLAEDRHDAVMLGVLAWRLDAIQRTPYHRAELSGATMAYLSRRSWRYLRQLGQAVPELYPHFAVQVLRHYPLGFRFSGAWIANQIWAHADLIGARNAWQSGPPAKLDRRAFDDAWKIAPEPLLRLLEDAHSDEVCDFAIRGLRADFPESLRQVDPRWLARIGAKPLASVHAFVVQVLRATPELHPSRFVALGLHDMVLGLLRSDSEEASAYAVDYAKAHAPDIPVDELIAVAEDGGKAARELARARLAGMKPAALGLDALVRMLATSALAELAGDKLGQGFAPGDLTAAHYVALAGGTRAQQRFVQDFYKRHKQVVPAAFLRAHAESPDISRWERRRVLETLGKRKARDIGIEWIRDALLDARFGDAVAEWLRAGMLAGSDLDVDWVKGLAMRPARRALALELLGNPKLVAPRRVGLAWLLAMARQADESLSGFAHRYLLEHFAPADFAPEADDAGSARQAAAAGAEQGAEQGIGRLWALLAPGQPAPVRHFAATYLKVHHPELGPTTDEARSLGVKPRMSREAYSLVRVRPLFADASPEVRRLARAIGRHELVRWDEPALIYELAASAYREGRALATELLLQVGEPDADPGQVPPAAWLVPDRVFVLAESATKATREIALTLIRRHYRQLGGAARLGWLMESPDREVRLAAVRLLWERHRPLPPGQPRRPEARGAGGVTAGVPGVHERFASTEALRQFVRTVLFGLPPGRMERREATGDVLPDRPLPASRAKQRVIDVVRDMAVEDAGFAAVVVPVLEEFVHSRAKGEWQGCVAALARIRKAHPEVPVALPPALAEANPGAPGAPPRA